jgi:hypothetical protein
MAEDTTQAAPITRHVWPTVSERNDGITSRQRFNPMTHQVRFEPKESDMIVVIEPRVTPEQALNQMEVSGS